MKRHWLLLSKHDSRNLFFAEWAGTIAAFEWLIIIVVSFWMPTGYRIGCSVMISTVSVSLILALMGYRGIICGHAKSMGPLILFATNVCIFLLISVPVILMFIEYNT